MRATLIILVALLVDACTQGAKTHIAQDELLQQLQHARAPLLIDVRSAFEYEAGHIPGAVHVPFWQAFTSDRLNGHQPSELLVLYCEHGPRAGIAKWGLSLQGFQSIMYLEGHMSAWRKAGLPITTDNK